MEIREINNKEIWENFLLQCPQKTFLHSWNWGEFQKALGNPPSHKASDGHGKIWRFGIYETGELVSLALVIKHIARRGSFLLVPHGPVLNFKIYDLRFKILITLMEKLKELAKKEGVSFVRIAPILEKTEENERLFKDLGFKLRPLHTHPEASWKLNIEPSEEELFNNMRKTTRYLIRQAQKNKDIEISQSSNIEDVEVFNKMHLEVVKRQNFMPFSLEYFKKEFEAFLPDNQVALFFAKYKGQPIAASYNIFWSGMSFYHHAALLPEYKKIPASYLLQWEAIKEAKKRNCVLYDFWGFVDPKINPHHPWAGPTLFKMGFGGQAFKYVEAQDFVISSKYWLNYIVEEARKIKRRL